MPLSVPASGLQLIQVSFSVCSKKRIGLLGKIEANNVESGVVKTEINSLLDLSLVHSESF